MARNGLAGLRVRLEPSHSVARSCPSGFGVHLAGSPWAAEGRVGQESPLGNPLPTKSSC